VKRHSRPGRFRAARRGRKDQCGALRARAERALFRHLLRHADGGDRGGAQSGGIEDANSTEFGAAKEPVVGLLTEWLKGNERERREAGGNLGGTMRLGAYPAKLAKGSRVAGIYGSTDISERHRHRYEVNTAYKDRLEQAGHAVFRHVARRDFAGDHRISRSSLVRRRAVSSRTEIAPVRGPHPLFASFIGAAVEQSRLV
jgi:CTP synthase